MTKKKRTKRRKEEKMTIKLRELQNKSRKGTYLYIKIGKRRGNYYKYKGHEFVDAYVNYYKDRYIKKKTSARSVNTYIKAYEEKVKGIKPKHRIRPHRQAERYLTTLKKRRPTLHKAIREGITQVKITDVRTASPKVIDVAKKKLLRPLVLDQELLEIISTEENMKKMKERFEYRLEFLDKKGQILATDSKIAPHPEEIIRKLQEKIAPMEEVLKDATPQLQRKLQQLGFENWNWHKDGKVWKTEMTIIFRKAR